MSRRDPISEREAERFQAAVDANPPMAASGPPEGVVPKQVFEVIFGGLLGWTPRIWDAYVQFVVDRYGTEFEATKTYSRQVWKDCMRAKGPPENW